MEEETRKLLGICNGTMVVPAPFVVSAHCNRVAVEDGHTEAVSVKFARPATAEEILTAWREFHPVPQQLRLPSAPQPALVYDSAIDHPQPRFDLDRGAGMAVSLGRLRPCGVLDWGLSVVAQYNPRCCRRSALLNAELMRAQGYLD